MKFTRATYSKNRPLTMGHASSSTTVLYIALVVADRRDWEMRMENRTPFKLHVHRVDDIAIRRPSGENHSQVTAPDDYVVP